jgi:hypothetical protein
VFAQSSFYENMVRSQNLPQILATHCSYFDIYISQKIRLCIVDLEDKFQTNLQAKPITFLVWKFKYITLIFLLFFAEFVKFTAFYKLLLLFQKVEMFELWFLHQIVIQACQLFGIAATVCKKQWCNRFEFQDQKNDGFSQLVSLKFAFQINYTQPDFSWNVNVQIATVYSVH